MGETIESIKEYLDLVALAIVADVVSLTGENRILCYYGLEQINQSPRPGLKAIIDTLDKDNITINE